jgi:hypothetical protein
VARDANATKALEAIEKWYGQLTFEALAKYAKVVADAYRTKEQELIDYKEDHPIRYGCPGRGVDW